MCLFIFLCSLSASSLPLQVCFILLCPLSCTASIYSYLYLTGIFRFVFAIIFISFCQHYTVHHYSHASVLSPVLLSSSLVFSIFCFPPDFVPILLHPRRRRSFALSLMVLLCLPPLPVSLPAGLQIPFRILRDKRLYVFVQDCVSAYVQV